MFETAVVTLIIKFCRVSESFDVVENLITTSVLCEKSVSRKMHNFLPGRPSLLHVTTWKFCRFQILLAHNQQYPKIRPNFSGSHTFSLTATAEIGPDTNSLTFVLVTARFWP